MRYLLLLMAFSGFLLACSESAPQEDTTFSLAAQLRDVPSLSGKKEYLASPFVTAGDQMYLVGHQDGSFPDLGWHVTGEMGGLWQHPIKLSDGFAFQLEDEQGNVFCLDGAEQFVNYPIASRQHFSGPADLSIDRIHFVSDESPGLVIELYIRNNGSKPYRGNLQFTNRIDLRPVWLGERTGMEDKSDTFSFDAGFGAWVAQDQENSWFCAWRSSLSGKEVSNTACAPESGGQGIDATSSYALELRPGAETSIHFYVAGSVKDRLEALKNLERLQQNLPQLFSAKRTKYEKIAATAALELPDPELTDAYTWTKYASEWLRFEIPTKGTGIAAGIPDYPWWFGCDQTYAVRGLVGVGMAKESIAILETLLQLSNEENGNGRIVHEVSTNGAVYNPGNINETPHFISAAWEVFCWTGDTDFLAKAYQQAKAGLTWLEAQDKDKNGYPDGHGMMEIHGMDAEMIDVIAYTYEAYLAAARMAEYFEETDQARQFARLAETLKQKINTEWWVPSEASFADFRAKPQKALALVDGAIIRADTLAKPWSVADLQRARAVIQNQEAEELQAYAFYHNWVVNTPLETGAAVPDYAAQALQTGYQYVNPFGMYVTGIDRKQEEENPEAFAALKAEETFNYTGAVMTLPTGVQAIAAARYGQPDLALNYLQRMVRSFSFAHPGSMYEVSPDYGMLVQAWNIYALARPLVSHFLGIEPRADLEKIKISPMLPSSWDKASIKQLPIGDNTIELLIDGANCQINQTQDWEITFVAPSGKRIVTVNGRPMPPGTNEVLLAEKENILQLE